MGEAKRKEAAAMNGYVKCCMNCNAWVRRSAGNKMGTCHANPPVLLLAPMERQVTTPNGIQTQFIPSVDGYWPPVPDTECCRKHEPLLHPAIADRDALAKIGSLDSLELEPTEGNAD